MIKTIIPALSESDDGDGGVGLINGLVATESYWLPTYEALRELRPT